jgi:dihydroorotate dehydrogenase
LRLSNNTDRDIKNSLVVYEDSPAGTLLSTLDVIRRQAQAVTGPGFGQQVVPKIPLIASSGVNQDNVGDFITAGAVALGIGSALIARDAVRSPSRGWIAELARRFTPLVKEARTAAPTPD